MNMLLLTIAVTSTLALILLIVSMLCIAISEKKIILQKQCIA